MIIAATGHRPDKLGGYNDTIFNSLIFLAQKALYNSKTDKVISGMALGWDTAIAIAARSLNIPYIAAIPFRGQENRWPPRSKDLYKVLLDNASDVVYVCEDGYAAWKMQHRNEWMVNNSDILLALWNGTAGGTGNCVQYATQKQKRIINLWDYWQKHNSST